MPCYDAAPSTRRPPCVGPSQLTLACLSLAQCAILGCLFLSGRGLFGANSRERDPSACGTAQRCVLSFALYGNSTRYTENMLVNAQRAQTIYAGWTVRVHYDSSVPAGVIASLHALGVETVRVRGALEAGGIAGMFWRFLVAEDLSVDRFVVRDADAWLLARERWAVDEWIRSGRKMHIMRDHPMHCVEVLGGTWGAVRGAIPPGLLSGMLAQSAKHQVNMATHGGDQDFLRDVLWNKLNLRDDHVAHDSYCCMHYPNTRPFPRERESAYVFVGMVSDPTGAPNPIAAAECPLQCRPAAHPDWRVC